MDSVLKPACKPGAIRFTHVCEKKEERFGGTYLEPPQDCINVTVNLHIVENSDATFKY